MTAAAYAADAFGTCSRLNTRASRTIKVRLCVQNASALTSPVTADGYDPRMADDTPDEIPWYAPAHHRVGDPPRQSQHGELLFEFYVEARPCALAL